MATTMPETMASSWPDSRLNSLLDSLDPGEQTDLLNQFRKRLLWMPNPGPQAEAFLSDADELYFGGAAGGGKTHLAFGLALTQHRNSLILRRQATDTKAISELFRGLPPKVGRWRSSGYGGEFRTADGRLIVVGGCQHEDDWKKYQGQAQDLYVFDELPHFSETIYSTLIAWNRVRDPLRFPNQRCRVLAPGNPPTDPQGDWVLKRWRAWLDPEYQFPAKPGELRWYYRNAKGEDAEADGPGPIPNAERPEAPFHPKSRTFIPAKLEDNPVYMAQGYAATLEALPEPMRSMMRWGDFAAGRIDGAWQLIPSLWVSLAQKRWYLRKEQGFGPLSQLGCDPAHGGTDEFTLAMRHGRTIAEVRAVSGRLVPDGKAGARLVKDAGGCTPGVRTLIDVIGVGGRTYDAACEMAGCDPVPIVVSHATNYRDPKIPEIEFMNERAAMMWNLRLALDPEGGPEETRLALPPDRELMTDLCAPRYYPRASGIQVESKDDIEKRIGRSTDRGDAVALAEWNNTPSFDVAFNVRR